LTEKLVSTINFIVSIRAKSKLHELMQQDAEFSKEDREKLNPCNASSITAALDFVKNPVRCCERVHDLIQKLVAIVKTKREDPKTKGAKTNFSYLIFSNKY
jgi:inositol-hexakisphosphate/diphosphoinositol-pentakisphosphate 1-kinase